MRAEHPSILSKAFALLAVFDTGSRVLTLSRISRESGMPKSTVHRLLGRLLELNAIEREGDGYRVGLGLMRLSAIAPAAGLRDRALMELADLHRATRAPAHLAVLRGHDVVVLERFSRSGEPSILRPGATLPARSTAVGKVLLSYTRNGEVSAALADPSAALTPRSVREAEQLYEQLRAVRRTGVVQETDETEVGMTSIAAPITAAGDVIAAIGLEYRRLDVPEEGAASLLRAAADEVARKIVGARTSGTRQATTLASLPEDAALRPQLLTGS